MTIINKTNNPATQRKHPKTGCIFNLAPQWGHLLALVATTPLQTLHLTKFLLFSFAIHWSFHMYL